MPARMDEKGNVVLPRGESFGFVLPNCGTEKLGYDDGAELCVIDKTGKDVLRKAVHAEEDGSFKIPLRPEDTMDIAEGDYMYDIVVVTDAVFAEKLEAGENSMRYTLFAPQLRRFVIGRTANG